MRLALSSALMGLFMCISALAQGVSDAAPAIRDTIQRQVEAFLRDDFAAAFEYAAPNIRTLFGTPENFGAMVRNGYPMVWRPDGVQFGPLEEINGVLWQTVLFRDGNGIVHAMGYRMVQTDGDWRISAVQRLPQPDPSV